MLVKQTDARLTEADAAVVGRFLFGVLEGANEKDNKAWRRFWRAINEGVRGEYFKIKVWRQRSGPFHRLVFLVLKKLFEAQDRITEFSAFRSWVRIGAGFVEYIPQPDGELVVVPKSMSFDECSEEEIRQFFDDAMVFFRTSGAYMVLWPHLTPQIAEQGMEKLLLQFERPMT